MCDTRREHRRDNCICREHGPRIEAFVVPCILMVLRKRPIHGYELMEQLASLPFLRPVPDPGVVYRHLRHLEGEGMVASALEPGSGGPARKVYTLTGEGESYLGAWLTSLRSRRDSINSLLAAAERVAGPDPPGNEAMSKPS